MTSRKARAASAKKLTGLNAEQSLVEDLASLEAPIDQSIVFTRVAVLPTLFVLVVRQVG
jgi:hypothetical protein